MKQQVQVETQFKRFADFLLKSHLDTLSQEIISKLQEMNLPLLKLLSRYSEAEQLDIQRRRWIEFLTTVSDGTGMLDMEKRIKEWRDQKTFITAADFSPTDTSLVYVAQKYALLKLIPVYTMDYNIAYGLVLEIEDFYTKVNKLFYTAYADFQHEKLTREKDFIETLIDNSVDEILAFDKELKITVWNKKFEENFKISKAEAIGKGMYEIFPQYINTPAATTFQQVLTGVTIELPTILSPITKRYKLAKVVPLILNEEIIGGLLIVHDVTDFKSVEEQLTEREKFISNITTSIPQLIYVFDLLEQKNVYINRSVVAYLGYSESQIEQLGDSILDAVMHPDEREALKEHFTKVANSEDGSVHEYTYRMCRADGTWRWFICRDTLFKRTPEGNAWQILGTSEDITEKREIDLRIQQAELINKEIQVLAHIGHYEWNAVTNAIWWSDEMFRIYGYEPNEIDLKAPNIEQLTIPEDVKQYRNELLAKLYTHPGKYDYEHSILKKDGSTGVIRGTVASYTDEMGRVIKVTGYAQDVTERFNSEKKLKESEYFNKMITLSSPDFIFVYDLVEDELLYTNKSLEEYLGYHSDAFSKQASQTIQTFIHPDDIPNVIDHIQRLHSASDGQIVDVEYRLKDAKGNYRWIRSQESVFKRDASGKVIQAVGNSQDITSYKEAKLALIELNAGLEERIKQRTLDLEESRKRISLITNSIPALIAYVNKDQRYEYVNKAYSEWLGREQEYYVGRTVREVGGDAMYSIIEPYVNRVLQGELVRYEPTINYPTGTKTVQASYIPDRNEEGEVIGFIVLVIDVTKQKQLEAELRQREKEIRLIADSLPASITYLDQEERYRFANKMAVKWSGRGDGIIGLHLEENLGNVYHVVKDYVKRALSGEAVSYDLRYKQIDHERDARIQYVPDIAETGEVRGFVCLIIDNSEDRKKEADLKRKNDELTKINNDLDNFIYTASHDLKAPVSNIEGLVNALSESLREKNQIDQENEMFLKLINESLHRFQSTIRDLTEISKVQRNIQEDVHQINLVEIVNEVKWSLNSLINESKATIETSLDDHFAIRFSKVNLRSILQNLISNAIKYRSPERQTIVKLSATKLEDYCILEVSDNGLGIKEGQQEKIFQMFKRLHDHVEGTGIGLYIVKRIVENAGGKIELESEEGKGSLFRVYLPIR